MLWNDHIKEFPNFRDDDLNKKEAGLILLRYERVLQQQGEKLPDNFPFKELLPAAKADTSRDPFDVLEMLGVTPDTAGKPAAPGGQTPAPAAPR